jgi:ABC-type transport system involved in multi-copper enzyme maturation permease subunit
MLDEFENIYQAKIELVKLEGIERTSGILSRMTGVLLVALIIIVACVAGLALLSMLIGHWLQDGTVALYVFSGSILLISVVLIVFRRAMIVRPLNNMLIKMLYEELP